MKNKMNKEKIITSSQMFTRDRDIVNNRTKIGGYGFSNSYSRSFVVNNSINPLLLSEVN